jgi:hypothetical protein
VIVDENNRPQEVLTPNDRTSDFISLYNGELRHA